MVAKIRRNFFQYRMLWERLNRRESEEKALLEELLRNFCQYRMLTRLVLSTCIYWAPMWDHYEEKALLDGPSSEVHLGRRSRDWNRREPEEKALLDGHKD